MPARPLHACPCAVCQEEAPHPLQDQHRQMNLLLSRLDAQQRRWYAALEANRLGHGGEQAVAQITGVSVKTIHRSQQDLATALAARPTTRVRLPGGGRPRAEKKMRP